jgi:hypothetical protein
MEGKVSVGDKIFVVFNQVCISRPNHRLVIESDT